MNTRSASPHKTPSPAAVVLAIGGSDNSGGAGIQADVKTGAAFGAFVCTIITAITAQNADTVLDIFPVPVDQVRQQWHSLIGEMPIAAIKLGMLASEQTIDFLAEVLPSMDVPIVIDPVLSVTSGYDLTRGTRVVDLYKQKLFPLATLITPNLPEAAQLLGCEMAQSFEDMEAQVHALAALGAKAVLLKGGHAQLRLATDILWDGELYPFSGPMVESDHTHGGGCTLATAIAAGLAQGLSIKQSVAAAKTYMQGAIAASGRLHLAKANGPIHHFYTYW